jgi:2-amino-4-hydroxy-6-hydroxymethyldihydropteridine diphosphokinase
MTEHIIAYIGIGSNVGDREENCRKAVELLREAGTVTAVSSFYETEPIGLPDQREFINAVAAVETSSPPNELLQVCRAIEERLGRKRGVRWGPRTADLDILLYGDAVLHLPDLEVPHPRMFERTFVLAPLAEIAPGAVHPLLKKTVAQLLAEVREPQRIAKLPPLNRTP